MFLRIEVAQNAGLRHVEVINGDEAFYPQPMKDYGEWLKLFIQSYFEPGGCRAPPPLILGSVSLNANVFSKNVIRLLEENNEEHTADMCQLYLPQ